MPLHVSQIPARPSTDFLDSSRATAPCHSSFEVPNPILKRVYLSERIHALPILQPFVLMVFHLMEGAYLALLFSGRHPRRRRGIPCARILASLLPYIFASLLPSLQYNRCTSIGVRNEFQPASS